MCLSGRFFCVVGFFALAADPRVFALRRVGNLGLDFHMVAELCAPRPSQVKV